MAEQTSSFTATEVSEQAQANLSAIIAGTMAFVKARGIPVSEWTTYLAHLFAPGWGEVRSEGATAIARAAALNMVSGGATLVEIVGDEQRAVAVVDWDVQSHIDWLPTLSQDDFRNMPAIFATIAEHLGMHYESSWDGNRVTMIFSV
jgi:hypothetical protein